MSDASDPFPAFPPSYRYRPGALPPVLLERPLWDVNVLSQEASGLHGVTGAHRIEDGLVFFNRVRQSTAQPKRRGDVTAHLVYQGKVNTLQVVVLGALDEEGVKGVVGEEEGVG